MRITTKADVKLPCLDISNLQTRRKKNQVTLWLGVALKHKTITKSSSVTAAPLYLMWTLTLSMASLLIRWSCYYHYFNWAVLQWGRGLLDLIITNVQTLGTSWFSLSCGSAGDALTRKAQERAIAPQLTDDVYQCEDVLTLSSRQYLPSRSIPCLWCVL